MITIEYTRIYKGEREGERKKKYYYLYMFFRTYKNEIQLLRYDITSKMFVHMMGTKILQILCLAPPLYPPARKVGF